MTARDAAPLLYAALQALVTHLDSQAIWFDAPEQVDTLERHMGQARAALAAASQAEDDGQGGR